MIGWLIVGALIGLLLGLVVGTLLFQASCALVDVPERGYFRSLLLYSASRAVLVPMGALGGVLVWYIGRFDSDPNDAFGTFKITATLGSMVLNWFLCGVLYALFLAASLRKGLLIAGIELLLVALASALIAAIVLVVLAFVQISTRPPPAKVSRETPANTIAQSGSWRRSDAGTL